MSVFHSSCEAEAVLSFYAKIPPEVQRERRSRDGGHSVKRWRVPRGRWCVQSGEGTVGLPSTQTQGVGVLDPPFGLSLGGWNACRNFKTTSC